jgi:hypothetical protein
MDQGSVRVDTPAAYARGFVYRKSSLVLKATSGKLQATSRKLDKKTI